MEGSQRERGAASRPTPALSRFRARKLSVFRSVFPTDQLEPPTPLLSSPPHRHAARTSAASLPATLAPVGDQLRWDQAWHAVTARFRLPTSPFLPDSLAPLPSDGDVETADDALLHQSLVLVLDAHNAVPAAAHTRDLLQWHTQQVRRHFVHHLLPLLASGASGHHHASRLLRSLRSLEAAHRHYLFPLTPILRAIRHDDAKRAALSRFRRHLRAIVGGAWVAHLSRPLRLILRRLFRLALTVAKPGQDGISAAPQADVGAADARLELLALLDALVKIGLAGDKLQMVCAEVMDLCMQDFIRDSYSGLWTAPQQLHAPAGLEASGCMGHLGDWIEKKYAPLALEVLSRLGGNVSADDVERWTEVAVGRLASLRIRELLDIVLDWPASRGGLEDLRFAVATPQRRLQLTDTFSATLQKRLLHPGRSTVDILHTYMSMIRTFHALDSSKVLLDRVVHALQLYLCQREDAVRIVVTGLLANPRGRSLDDGKGHLVELAVLLSDASEQQRNFGEDDELDWNDMSWLPDPVDAGSNYKRPRNEDVIGTLINALGSQDIFIKEFQLIVAERLLSGQTAFQQEIKVLGLLKKRFGEHALQNCDVMIKDIYDSRRLDALLGRSLGLGEMAGPGGLPAYHAKILSRLFWPSLPRDSFAVPMPVAEAQGQYEAGFEEVKSSRKLSWLDQLGSAKVEIELEDRSLEVECRTYEAAIIYAFQEEQGEAGSGRFEELLERLMMDEDLLEAGLRFWVGKRVLRKTGPQTYSVVERLHGEEERWRQEGEEENKTGGLGGSSSTSHGRLSSKRKTRGAESKERERRTVYWQFIVGMLTNSSPSMPLGQISMMMKMLMADGCAWSNEELQDFLGEKVAGGELELVGGKYRLPKR